MGTSASMPLTLKNQTKLKNFNICLNWFENESKLKLTENRFLIKITKACTPFKATAAKTA